MSVVGTQPNLDRMMAHLGEPSDVRIELDRSEFDYRRIFVSNPDIAGRRLRDLNLQHRLGAIVTRVWRGDIELLPRGETVLELGNRVRVLTHRERMDAVSGFFGDSYRALSEIDILTFSLGLALDLTLRQIGLVLFLAGVGICSRYAFVTTFAQGGGILLFAAGAGITYVTALATFARTQAPQNTPQLYGENNVMSHSFAQAAGGEGHYCGLAPSCNHSLTFGS